MPKEIQPMIDMIDAWKGDGGSEPRRRKRRRRQRGQRDGQSIRDLKARFDASQAASPMVNVMDAMIQSTPDKPGWVPGPGLVPVSELPQSFRDTLPQGQWVGLDPSKLDMKAMEYLMKLKLGEQGK